MENSKIRGKHRIKAEEEIIRRREKETRYHELWTGTANYFDHWNKRTAKFVEWTSPRYYKENNELVSGIKAKKDKEESLTMRRQKLRKLFHEESTSFNVELMIHSSKEFDKPIENNDDVPTQILKELNDQVKLEEQARRKKEAETKLFDQWRRNNPLIRQCEAKYKCKDLKLSWLDQQIEKRIQKEKEEEEARRILKENERRLELEKEKEKVRLRKIEEEKHQLKEVLDSQIMEIKEKQKLSDELKEKENDEMQQQLCIAQLEEQIKLEEKRRRDKECALFNIRQHNRRIKQKCKDVQENLEQEKRLIMRFNELRLQDIIEERAKRDEIKRGIEEFLDIIKQQQALEIQRQKRLEFLFDSEAKALYNTQAATWKQEEMARDRLFKEVLDSLKQQINEKLEMNKLRQTENLREREEMTQKIEEYNEELHKLKLEETKSKHVKRQSREDEIKVKMAKKKQEESLRIKELDEELERIRKEEERLQKEILRIQQKRNTCKNSRNRLL
ncbi:unnamed protein product [Phyllotreta striolata]|uniref:Trichoplein keratin filament-binding protein n=1 Tax=Phyllotreta striolata TaxID=444603 RepID=A0A9N9TEC8_PHYSR|nr:unnamed protein product [Phyllotreta striolata]